MSTSTACPHCRTVVPGGLQHCLRCGRPVTLPTPAVDLPAVDPQAVELPAGPATDQAGTTGVFLEYHSRRRPLAIGLAVFGVLVATLGVLYLADWYFFRPARTVESYFDALSDRDAERARNLLVPVGNGLDQPLLDPAVLRSDAYQPPSDMRIETMEPRDDDDNVVFAQVSFALGGRRHGMVLELHGDRAAAGVFQHWRIAGGVYPVTVRAYGVDAAVVGGLTVPFPEEADTVRLGALPGDYTVALPDQPLLTAPVAHAYAGTDAEQGAAVQIEPTIRPDVREEVDRQIRARIDQCATATTLSPPGCPFSSHAFDEVRDVHWTITRYPMVQLRISELPGGPVVVRTVERGLAEVTGLADGFGDPYQYQDEDSISVSGVVTAFGGTVTWQPEDRD